MRFFSTALLLLICVIGGVSQPRAETQAPTPLDRVVAVVNDQVIVKSELDSKVRLVRAQLQAQHTQIPPENVLRKQVLDRMVVQRLELQLAANNGIKVDDETLNASMRRLARQNNMTLTQFRQTLQSEGYDYDQFREDIRHQIVIRRLQQKTVADRVHVTSQEVDNELARMNAQGQKNREYHLAHILVAVPEAASPAQIKKAHGKAEAILHKLRNGADFAETAVAQSDGQQALKGGDLGWRSAGQLPTFFANSVRKMKPGDVSDPIRTPSGFHIIKLVAERGGKRHVITQTLVRHILLKPSAVLTDQQARHELEQLRTRIENGADFATLAKAHSEDKVSAANGGSLGWVNPGQLVPRFEQEMKQLKIGQISQPFKTRFGWHIVQVLDRRQHDSTKDYRRTLAREQVHKRKTEEQLNLWLRRLRDEAYVEYHLDDKG